MKRRNQLQKAFAGIILFFSLTVNFVFCLASGHYVFSNPAERVDLAVYGVFNSNRTGHLNVPGFDGYARNISGQSVHGNFLNGTNSCATCHLAHIAPGQRFLFQRSIYNTCTSCHFSSMANTYNILSGGGGGRFFDPDFDPDRSGMSQHLSTGAKTHAEAPGAAPDGARRSWWESRLSCGSCHAPHGSHSPRRYLQVNPNGGAARFGPIILERGMDGKFRPAEHADKVPWLYYDYEADLHSLFGVIIHDGSGNPVRDGIFIHYREGYVEIADPQHGPYRITFSQALVVDMDVEPDGNGNELITYRAGVVNFCVSCHTNYLRRDGESFYTDHAFFTHRINMDITANPDVAEPDSRFALEKERNGTAKRLVCLSCHFAHGTDASLMLDSRFNFMYQPHGPALPPERTYLLRFGERESCKMCHLNLLSREPAAGAQLEVPPGELRLLFDQDLNAQTVVSGDTLIVSDGIDLVAGTVFIEDNRTVIFQPAAAFEAGKSYTVTVGTGIRSTAGRSLPNVLAYTFTVNL